MHCQRTNAFSRKLSLAVCLLLCGSFTSCGNVETESAVSESEDATSSTANYELDNKLLENEKNVAGNGYIIINDEADYPDWIDDIRYVEKIDENLYSVRDFSNNELFTFESEKYTLRFSEGLSYFCKDGEWGFIDLNGNIVIEPQYDGVGMFFNGTCYVHKDSDEFFIDKQGNKADDKRYDGFEGSLDKLEDSLEMLGDNSWYSNFTGTYMRYGYLVQSEDEISEVQGYADKYGNLTEIKDAKDTFSFYNGYAAVENKDGELYFIDESFERVTSNIYDICNDQFEPIDFLNDGAPDTEYVFEGGYFISSLYSDSNPSGERKVIKIAPELYVGESF